MLQGWNFTHQNLSTRWDRGSTHRALILRPYVAHCKLPTRRALISAQTSHTGTTRRVEENARHVEPSISTLSLFFCSKHVWKVSLDFAFDLQWVQNTNKDHKKKHSNEALNHIYMRNQGNTHWKWPFNELKPKRRSKSRRKICTNEIMLSSNRDEFLV